MINNNNTYNNCFKTFLNNIINYLNPKHSLRLNKITIFSKKIIKIIKKIFSNVRNVVNIYLIGLLQLDGTS